MDWPFWLASPTLETAHTELSWMSPCDKWDLWRGFTGTGRSIFHRYCSLSITVWCPLLFTVRIAALTQATGLLSKLIDTQTLLYLLLLTNTKRYYFTIYKHNQTFLILSDFLYFLCVLPKMIWPTEPKTTVTPFHATIMFRNKSETNENSLLSVRSISSLVVGFRRLLANIMHTYGSSHS